MEHTQEKSAMADVKHTPGPMRPLTANEVAATAAARFRDQYKDWRDDDTFADGRTKQSVNDIFNSNPHTPEVVTAALNEGWAYPRCSCCHGYQHVAIEFADPWNSEQEKFFLCLLCIEHAQKMAADFPLSRKAVAKHKGGAARATEGGV